MTKVITQELGNDWALYHGDCVEVMRGLPENSMHAAIFSPPFSALYTYSNSERDLGNSNGDSQFHSHFRFVISELFRLIRPGRHAMIHCMNIPAMKERDGYIGLKDFRGDLIRSFQAEGFIFHSEHCIWKDPLIEATRTKALGLMHKQLCKDSSKSRAGIPEYLIAMRKPGDNSEPISHPHGLESFVGDNPPTDGVLSHERWRRYASPVWMDIRQGRTLNFAAARAVQDERHICPLSLDVIERCLELWTNPDEAILSPFAGIGSEGYQSILLGRRFVGIELKSSYFEQACKNLKRAEQEVREKNRTLFDYPPAPALPA